MSGTSIDGIDLVYVKFDNLNYKNYTIIVAETISYSKKWEVILQKAIDLSKKELEVLDVRYGQLIAYEINNFIKKHKIEKIDFISSHGHTIIHQPNKGITLQIGNGKQIADITNIKVICDFRTKNIKLGGQGAPLVPIGDKLLFSSFDYCINLGGFSNISYQQKQQSIAFDICPINIVLNYYCKKIGYNFDNKGRIASSGIVNKELFKKLNLLDYYYLKPPKSLGFEWVKKNVFPLIDSFNLPVKDILRTTVEHFAFQIGRVINKKKSILITGGGAYNSFLIKKIEIYTKTKVKLPSSNLINYKEALIFALLGLLRNKNEINCLKSVTGSIKNHSSGKIFYP